MTEYAISTNLISWAPAKAGIFGWPIDGPEAETIDSMGLGDLLLPKFAQTPDYRRSGGYQTDYVKAICSALRLDYDDLLSEYELRVARGAAAVPFLWRVTGEPIHDENMPGGWRSVPISVHDLRFPFSTSEFLRLRAIPIEIARQFKATAAAGRHIQSLPTGTFNQLGPASNAPRGDEQLRKLLLIRGRDGGDALRRMEEHGLNPRGGDYLFLVDESWIPGFFEVTEDGSGVEPRGPRIGQSPHELGAIVERAMRRQFPEDGFKPRNARHAVAQLVEFIESDRDVEPIAEFGQFYDRFVNLPAKTSQALEIAERKGWDEMPEPLPPRTFVEEPEEPEGDDEEGEEEDSEQLEEDHLRGLTVAEVEARLPELELPPGVLAEAVTALRAGKHLLLSGPPGTGKSVIAAALCRSVVGDEYLTATATADWTTFDTIGGYMPQDGGLLEFEPGIVLRCLERGRWLVIDELNRADIDKAFGPLFTLLSGSGKEGGGDNVTLPFRRADRSIQIVRSARRTEGGRQYVMTPTWRMIGTLNARDKASLFQLSFAFLRRFAVVDVPLPDQESYRELFLRWLGSLEGDAHEEIAGAAIGLAFGDRELGPAILKDIAEFTRMGLTPTETASASSPYDDPRGAFLTAVRLYAVPQYEGAGRDEVDAALVRLRSSFTADPPQREWRSLEQALRAITFL
ncbi:MAG TPA: AAA family ATPase [Solirubrobacterales bacterium]